MKYNYVVTDEGIETKQNVRTIKSGDSAGRRQMLDSTAAINKLIRYAQMMDELHLARAKARQSKGPGAVINKSQNHTVIFIGIIRIYQAVGRSFTITKKYLADRYQIDRGTVKKVLDDFIADGFLDDNYFPTDLLIEKYNEFVNYFCENPATENFCRSIAYGMMLRACPDAPVYERQLKIDAGVSAP